MRENYRKLMGCYYKNSYISAANYPLQPNLVQNQCYEMTPLVNSLICKLSNLHIHE